MYRIFLLLMVTVCGAQADPSRIEALGMIETGNNDYAIGSVGEISRYQLRPTVWHSYNASRSYTDVKVASGVARSHLDYLQAWFRKRAAREASDFDIYVMWNAGPTYYLRRGFAPERVHRVIGERAERFANLCRANKYAKRETGRRS